MVRVARPGGLLRSARRWSSLGTIAAALLFAAPSHAVRVVVEIADEVEPMVDVRLVRRLIRLELADVELPKVNDAGTPSGARRPDPPKATLADEEVVFVRLLREDDVLNVELWSLGTLSGERRLSLSGNPQHQARRIALASAELARRLREARVVERQRFLRQHLAPKEPEQVPAYLTRMNVRGSAGLSGVWLAAPQALLVGPRLGLGALTESGVGLTLTAAALTAADTSAVRSWNELTLRPSWQRGVDGFALEVAGQLGVAVVDISPSARFAGSETSRQTWSSKVALEISGHWLLSQRSALTIAPEAGWLVRRLELDAPAGPLRLGGVWIGCTLGARVYL